MADLVQKVAASDEDGRRCLANLGKLVSLPASWVDVDHRQMGVTLLDTLLSMLEVDLVYLRLNNLEGGIVELIRTADVHFNQILFANLLDEGLGNPEMWPLRSDFLSGLYITHAPVGLLGSHGVLVVASSDRDFDDEERLTLAVAANQAALWMGETLGNSHRPRRSPANELDVNGRPPSADVTSQKSQAGELPERRNSLRLAENMPGMVAILAEHGEVVAVNSQLSNYCGMTLDEIRNWKISQISHPSDLPMAIETIERAIADGENYELEARLRRYDGSYNWFQIRGVPIPDPSDGTVAWYVFLTDIEVRKRADEARIAREEELHQIVNAIPAMVWAATPAGTVEFLNVTWLNYAGVDATAVKRWWDVIHPDDVESLLETWDRVRDAGVPGQVEARFRRRDGEYRWFLIRCNPLFAEDGSVSRWYGTNTDIDDRKKAEEKLRHSEMLLAEGERTSHTGTFCWDLTTDEVTFSDELSRIFGFEQDMPVTIEKLGSRVHPDDRALLALKRDEIRSGGENPEYEVRVLADDGSVRYLRVVARGVEFPDGHIECIGAGQDVTERRHVEEARDKFRAELAHITRVMSLGTMTASIAHEVNQPLSGIITNAGAALRMLSAMPPDIDGAQEAARRAIRDTQRAAEVVSKVRALFKKQSYAVGPVDLNDAVREVIGLAGSDFHRNRIALHTELLDTLPQIEGDRVQLQQVVMNFLRNAAEAISESSWHPREIHVRTETTPEGLVELSVRDSGIGFDRDDVDHLFQAFYTTKSDGMGIGLSVSRSIIEGHQGRVWATRNDGAGATFGFRLPPLQTREISRPRHCLM